MGSDSNPFDKNKKQPYTIDVSISKFWWMIRPPLLERTRMEFKKECRICIQSRSGSPKSSKISKLWLVSSKSNPRCLLVEEHPSNTQRWNWKTICARTCKQLTLTWATTLRKSNHRLTTSTQHPVPEETFRQTQLRKERRCSEITSR